jgi:hypothetical protein
MCRGREHVAGINVPALTSFGVDQRGELFALSGAGQVFRIVKA